MGNVVQLGVFYSVHVQQKGLRTHEIHLRFIVPCHMHDVSYLEVFDHDDIPTSSLESAQ